MVAIKLVIKQNLDAGLLEQPIIFRTGIHVNGNTSSAVLFFIYSMLNKAGVIKSSTDTRFICLLKWFCTWQYALFYFEITLFFTLTQQKSPYYGVLKLE